MDKKYQVFVSSTFLDLKEERWKALQAMMNIDCIAAGMEWFPAIDQDQFEYIKKVIDNCDYYLLIIGGRYGSLMQEGISYTEKEYDYAVEKGLKVIALVHENIQNLPDEKKETDPILSVKLEEFKKKVANGRMISFWNTPSEIESKAIIGLTKAINEFPATGWIRGNTISNEDLLLEINELRKEIQNLKKENAYIKSQLTPQINNLATLEDEVELTYSYTHYYGYSKTIQKNTMKITWKKLFGLLSPKLLTSNNFHMTKLLLENAIREASIVSPFLDFTDSSFETIIFQFKALGLIACKEALTTNNTMAVFCKLTEKGEQLMLELKTVKKEK